MLQSRGKAQASTELLYMFSFFILVSVGFISILYTKQSEAAVIEEKRQVEFAADLVSQMINTAVIEGNGYSVSFASPNEFGFYAVNSTLIVSKDKFVVFRPLLVDSITGNISTSKIIYNSGGEIFVS